MAYDDTMNFRVSSSELGSDSAEKAASQLNRILASKAFRQADRLKRFLAFIVEETIAGRGERLKEFVVGVEVFGKDDSFDPRNDPIVRVQARRLRSQLARYYREEGQEDDLAIDLPKGGYAPIFRPLKVAHAKRSMPRCWSAGTRFWCFRMPTTARPAIRSISARESRRKSSIP